MADIKPVENEGVLRDTDIMGEKPVETAHIAELTEEEKAIEKKLVRRIDWIILPLILAVYLLNWIDRYGSFMTLDKGRRQSEQCG